MYNEYQHNDERETLVEYYKRRGIRDPGFSLGFPMFASGACAIGTWPIFINTLIKDWTWQPALFLAIAFTLIAIIPWLNYRHKTHIPRRKRKELEKAKQQEIELRTLRIRERELGLEPYDVGHLSSGN